MKSGDRIEYQETGDGDYRVRTGEVWSDGPVPSSVWVIPDGGPCAVAVRVPTRAQEQRGDRPRAMPEYPAAWQRDTVRRCDNVRRSDAVYLTRRPIGRCGSTVTYECVQHVGPDCPSAVSLERDASPYSVGDLIDILLLRRNHHASVKLCQRCVYLDGTAGIGSAS